MNNYQKTFPNIRQLVADQDARRAELAQMPRAERESYFAELAQRLFPATDEPQFLSLDDLQSLAIASTGFGGKILTLETVCAHLFSNANFYIENGYFTRENIESLYSSFTARFN